jgi:hypothetical protein
MLDDSDYLLLRALAHGSSVLPAAVSAFLSEHVFASDGPPAAGGGGAAAAELAEARRQQGGHCKCVQRGGGRRWGGESESRGEEAVQGPACAGLQDPTPLLMPAPRLGPPLPPARAAPVAALTAALDAPEEVLEAALSFLQAEEAPALQALPSSAAALEVRFHR